MKTPNSTIFTFFAYYILSIILGLTFTVLAIYAFVSVWGWSTFLGMCAIGIVLQAWFWTTMYFHGRNVHQQALNEAVERNKES